LEFLRSRARQGILEVFFWKDYRNREVDFLAMKNRRAAGLCQITYAETMSELAPREIESLMSAAKIFSCDNLMIVTWGLEAEIETGGKKIKFIPLWKFLYEPAFFEF
jgi:hypothetical protein